MKHMQKPVRNNHRSFRAFIGGLCVALTASPLMAEGFFPYMDPTAVQMGKDLYEENCASCHGANLEGEPNWRTPDPEGYLPAPPHDATGHTWHHPDKLLFMITKFGTEAMAGPNYKSRMAGFQDTLQDDEIIAILAYIKSTWPKHIIARHDKMNASN